MLVTAAQVADTLALAIPGFVLMKVFYLLGFQTKRSDAQWVIWSILATAPLVGLTNALLRGGSDWRVFPLELFIALAAGGSLAVMWRGLARLAPSLQGEMTIGAWDNVVATRRWLLVELKDGRRFKGWPKYVARSVDTDDVDLFIADPAVVVGDTYIALDSVEGILLKRSDITMITALKGVPRPAASGDQKKTVREAS